MSAGATARSIVGPTPAAKRIAGILVAAYALVAMVPLVWIFMTGFKTPADAIASPPRVIFEPGTGAYAGLLATSSGLAGPFANSVIVGFGSTFMAVVLGTLAAYGFSRFRVPLKNDLLFVILSTRMLPPVAVAIPIFLMYRSLGLADTHLGMILLYTAANVSLAVWLLKSFIDEIPREYEEAAMVDGYTRLQAFARVVLPQAKIRQKIAVAAASTVLLVPVLVFTIVLRKHLLRAITFGAVRK